MVTDATLTSANLHTLTLCRHIHVWDRHGHEAGLSKGLGWRAGPHTCLPMQEARPWLQAISLPIRHLQWGALPFALLLIRAGLGRGQRGVWEAHPGEVGDLERWWER